jgi:hypothetical protein
MIEGLVLVETTNVDPQVLQSMSLMNAKPLVMGKAPGMGTVLHLAANSADDFTNALQQFARVQGVKGLLTLAMRIL